METIDFNNPDFYLNREISMLEFNWRVLQQALDLNDKLQRMECFEKFA